jgi:hypothetical protein
VAVPPRCLLLDSFDHGPWAVLVDWFGLVWNMVHYIFIRSISCVPPICSASLAAASGIEWTSMYRFVVVLQVEDVGVDL